LVDFKGVEHPTMLLLKLIRRPSVSIRAAAILAGAFGCLESQAAPVPLANGLTNANSNLPAGKQFLAHGTAKGKDKFLGLHAGGKNRGFAGLGGAGRVSVDANGKLIANIGGNDTLVSLPPAAFGLLPSKSGAGAGFIAPGKLGTLSKGRPFPTFLQKPGNLQSGPGLIGVPKATLSTAGTLAIPVTTASATKISPGTLPKSPLLSPATNPIFHFAPTGTSATATSGAINPTTPATGASTGTKTNPVSTTASTSAVPLTPRTAATTTATTNAAVSNPSVVRTTSPAAPNVILDNSLGQTGTISITPNLSGANDYAVDQTAGVMMGSNLFFSFLQFNLIGGESASFNGPASVQNVLARVTNGSPSTIDGTINVNIPGANFFLINPAGVMFTSNASLNISGSFTVTTANYLKLADGHKFTAAPGPTDLTLTDAPVSAFGFLQSKSPKPVTPAITFSGGFYVLNEGTNFSAIGGNQTFNGTFLIVPGGQISLISAGNGNSTVEIPWPRPPCLFRPFPLRDRLPSKIPHSSPWSPSIRRPAIAPASSSAPTLSS
jgi:filamentous hemagglutinin family protein